METTLLVGNFGAHNLGDEMIFTAALQDYPDSVVMTSDPEFSQRFTEKKFETVPFPPTGFRSLLRFLVNRKYRADIATLRHCDIKTLVFPGGGLFAIKTRACWLWFLIFVWLKHFFPKAEFRFEHQGVDQDMSWLSKKLTRFVFARADYVSVRDEASGQALEVLGIKNYVLSEDRVFSYLKNTDVNALTCPESDEKLLIISALESFDVSVIEKKYPDHQIIFIPFALSDMSVLPDNFTHEVIFPKNKTELFSLLSQSDILVGERFHSLVCGYHFCETFVLREPYSEKVESFCEKHKIKIFK